MIRCPCGQPIAAYHRSWAGNGFVECVCGFRIPWSADPDFTFEMGGQVVEWFIPIGEFLKGDVTFEEGE